MKGTITLALLATLVVGLLGIQTKEPSDRYIPARPYRPMSVQDWLAGERLGNEKRGIPAWADAELPQGDLHLPESAWVEIDSTFEYEPRVSIVGAHSSYANSMPGFTVGQKWRAKAASHQKQHGELLPPSFMVRSAPGNQGGHNQPNYVHHHHLSFDCGYIASGYALGGGQITTLSQCAIFQLHPDGVGLAIQQNSHALAVRDLSIQGGPVFATHGTLHGTGVQISSDASLNGSNWKLHMLKKGIVGNNSHEVILDGVHWEKVAEPIVTGKWSSNWRITGEVQMCGPVVVDFTNFGGAMDFTLSIRKPREGGVPGAATGKSIVQYYRDYYGREIQFATLLDNRHDRQVFRFTTRADKSVEVVRLGYSWKPPQ